MWKYVLLLGGLGGLMLSLLVTWRYPDDVNGLNLIIYSDDDVYRYNVDTSTLHYLRRQPAWSEFSNLIDVSERPSPNGQWTAITYSAEPDKVFIIDNVSGSILQSIELRFDDSNNYFGKWSPDSRHIGWITFVLRENQTYVHTLNVLSGDVRHFPLPSEFFPAGRWLNVRTIEVWSASQFGSYIIDMVSGNATFEDHVSPDTVNNCCAYAYTSEEGIHLYEGNQRTLVFKTNALEALATEDLRHIAYLQADGDETAHIFTYNTQTGENRQVTQQSIFVGANCVGRSHECTALTAWSPDGEWISFREGRTLKILNVNSGQTHLILDSIGSAVWSRSTLTEVRQKVGWWIVSSVVVMLIGLWRMVT